MKVFTFCQCSVTNEHHVCSGLEGRQCNRFIMSFLKDPDATCFVYHGRSCSKTSCQLLTAWEGISGGWS